MNRREFLNSAVATTLVGGAMVKRVSAQQMRPYPGTTREIPMHADSRYLHWLRTPQEVAKACQEISCRALMVTVQDGATAHVQQANVTTGLPAFVRALGAEGIGVKMIRGGGQTDVDADVERLVGTMAGLGITHYSLGSDSYDLKQPLMPQLDAIKRKVERFVALNQRHGTTLVYHTRSGTNTVGGSVWDLVHVFQGLDPKRVGFLWDTGEMALHGPAWESMIRAAGPYLAVVSWKDKKWEQDLGRLTYQGGFFPETPSAAPEGGDEDAPAGAAGRGGAGGGRGGGGAAGAAAGRGGGGGRGGGAAGAAAGRGGAAAPDPLDGVPRPLAGQHFARGMGWTSKETAMGTGAVNFFRYGEVLAEMGFNGLMTMQAQYEGLGGAESGQTAVTAGRRVVLGALKRDVLTVRAALAQSGSGIMV